MLTHPPFLPELDQYAMNGLRWPRLDGEGRVALYHSNNVYNSTRAILGLARSVIKTIRICRQKSLQIQAQKSGYISVTNITVLVTPLFPITSTTANMSSSNNVYNSGSPMTTVTYCRVSTADQTVDNQALELQGVADKAGWEIAKTYTDVISGAKSKRIGLDALMRGVRRKEVDRVLIWDISRLGRSLQHLIGLLEEFQANGVALYFHQQALDTSTPSGKAMFQMLGVFSEFERGMIQERVKAGLQRAKAQGKRLGRPPVPPIEIHKIRKLRDEGLSYRKIAKRVDLSVCTVHRLCA